VGLKAYSEINLHITWHVKGDVPVLRDEIDGPFYKFLRGQVIENSGAYLHQIGGTDDHVHLVATVPPTLLVSEWVGQLKGASSHYVNHHPVNRKVLEWQSKYGVVSFGTKDLPWVVEYVRNQREHHAGGKVQPRLERTEIEDDGEACSSRLTISQEERVCESAIAPA
jgi:putative transposase